MAFGITVHRREDEDHFNSPPAVTSAEFDVWQAECERRWLYESPIGSDGIVFDWWHVPAHHLGLCLIAEVYHSGLEVSGGDLEELDKELDRLEAYWKTTDFSAIAPAQEDIRQSGDREQADHIPLLNRLQEGLACVREAISIARRGNGILVLN